MVHVLMTFELDFERARSSGQIEEDDDEGQVMGRVIDWLREGLADVTDGQPQVRIALNADPNPVQSETTIHFTLPAAGKANLQIVGTDGRVVRTLLKGVQSAGKHSFLWNRNGQSGERVASGVYFYRLETDIETTVRKVILLD